MNNETMSFELEMVDGDLAMDAESTDEVMSDESEVVDRDLVLKPISQMRACHLSYRLRTGTWV